MSDLLSTYDEVQQLFDRAAVTCRAGGFSQVVGDRPPPGSVPGQRVDELDDPVDQWIVADAIDSIETAEAMIAAGNPAGATIATFLSAHTRLGLQAGLQFALDTGWTPPA